MFQIPAAEQKATEFKKIAYGRYGESVSILTDEKNERIKRNSFADWSGLIIKNATIDDLDSKAVSLAKE